jgi:hypothetical protein
MHHLYAFSSNVCRRRGARLEGTLDATSAEEAQIRKNTEGITYNYQMKTVNQSTFHATTTLFAEQAVQFYDWFVVAICICVYTDILVCLQEYRDFSAQYSLFTCQAKVRGSVHGIILSYIHHHFRRTFNLLSFRKYLDRLLAQPLDSFSHSAASTSLQFWRARFVFIRNCMLVLSRMVCLCFNAIVRGFSHSVTSLSLPISFDLAES